MPQKKNVFRRLSGPGLLGSMLLCHAPLHAQLGLPGSPGSPGAPGTPGAFGAPVRVSPNDQVLKTWQQSNLGGAVPALTRGEDGSTRLDWRGGVSLDVYSNDIQSAGGSANTPLRSGTFYKSLVTSDLRSINENDAIDHFQVVVTNSDDRAVLSQNQYQINQLQVGRTAADYQVALGDIAPNFSNLGSALGVRGVYGQRQLGDTTVHGYAGQVAENWEALSSVVPSNQYIRDVHGVKVETAFGYNLRTYATAQAFSEREAPIMAQPGFSPLGSSHSMSVGFQYQKDQWSLTGETAGSSFQDNGTSDRQGRATVLDASWRGESVALRGGYHHIDTEYTSLSFAAQPGIHETYIGADWTAASWLTLATDIRKSKNSTLANAYSESTFVDTDALTLRANINFGPEHPGWMVSLQTVEAQSTDSAAFASRRSDVSAMLNYASPILNAGLGLGQGKLTNEAYPYYDSATNNWSLNIGSNFSDAQPDAAPTWSAGVNFFAASQTQRLLAGDGGESNNTNYTLALTGQRIGLGGLNLLLTAGETTQPNGGPSLHLRGAQLDAVFPMKGQNTFKLYVRSTRRYMDDPLLSAQEDVFGMQLIYNF
ncbi:MAG: collagen-like protein [Pseudomonadota bacterium]